MKHKILILIFIVAFGIIYFDTHYALIDKKIYKTNIKYISVHLLDIADVKSVNRCAEIEEMHISGADKDLISKFRNFKDLHNLMIMHSNVSSIDCKQISRFNTLCDLCICNNSTIDFNNFNNNISCIRLIESKIMNLKYLSKCLSLEKLIVSYSTISDNHIIIENGIYILNDSSVFAPLDSITYLTIRVDEIEDISGILEMDSLETFCVNKDSISEEYVKLLEDKGITVTYAGD